MLTYTTCTVYMQNFTLRKPKCIACVIQTIYSIDIIEMCVISQQAIYKQKIIQIVLLFTYFMNIYKD